MFETEYGFGEISGKAVIRWGRGLMVLREQEKSKAVGCGITFLSIN